MCADIRRRAIALIAAYAVALQALLPSVALAAGVFPDTPLVTELCSGAAVPGDLPADRQGNVCLHPLACLVTGCTGMVAALMRDHASFGAVRGVHSAAIAFLLTAAPQQHQTTLPRFARPPPLA